MPLNLNNPADFATATLSQASSLLTTLSGVESNQWEIQEAAYGVDPNNLILFHVFKSSVNYSAAVDEIEKTLSRRIPEYKYLYVDGQTTDDLGRDGTTYEFNAIIFGPNYYNAYVNLQRELNKPSPGTLRHPVDGLVTVRFKSARVIHRANDRQAVILRLSFVEHNFEVSFGNVTPTLKSSLADAAAFLSSISATITSVQRKIAVLSSIKQAIVAEITSFESGFLDFLISLNASFNSGTSADIPALLPANPATGGQIEAFPSLASTTGTYADLTPAQAQQQQALIVSPSEAQNQLADLTGQAASVISTMEAANEGQGALIFYSETVTIREAALAAKAALLLALQTSNSVVKNYTTPRLMSIREVCFAVGLTPDDSQTVLTLNPTLLSANFIPMGTVLQVPNV